MRNHQSEYILLTVFTLLFATLGLLSPDRFLTMDNLQSMASQMPEFGIIALGMMVVILTGGINLSITTTATLAGIAGAYVLGGAYAHQHAIAGITLGILVTLLVALLCGLVNGALVAWVGVPSILATLGTMILFEGISLNLTKGGAISGFPEAYEHIGNSSLGPVPIPLIIYLLAILATTLAVERSRRGAELILTGCNPVAADYAGINVRRVQLHCYLYSGLMAGLACVIMNSRYNSAKVDYGSTYLLQSVAAVVLGGTSITGGHGKVLGTVLAVAIIQILSSGLNILGINRNLVDITTGAILIIVLTVNTLSGHYGRRRGIRRMKSLKRFDTP
jgi:ribose/xylose/arabinose/galactoside ABC-type transport system permease subunit